jgi:hypothetical protein
MKWEFLVLDAVLFILPLIVTFFIKQFRLPALKPTLLSLIVVAILFIMAESYSVGYIWMLNPTFTLGQSLFKLPIELILFFAAMSWLSINVWVNLQALRKNELIGDHRAFMWAAIALVFIAAQSLLTHRIYTGFVSCIAAIVILKEYKDDKSKLLTINGEFYVLFMTVLNFFIFGYLLRRPILVYNFFMKTNVSILVVPLETVLYGFILTWLPVRVYGRFGKN